MPRPIEFPHTFENHRRLGCLFTQGRWRTLQRAEHAFGIAGDRHKVGAGRLVGFGAALLPVVQRALRESDNVQRNPP